MLIVMLPFTSIEIANAAETLDRLHSLERQFADGEIDAFCFAQQIGALWGVIDEQIVKNGV